VNARNLGGNDGATDLQPALYREVTSRGSAYGRVQRVRQQRGLGANDPLPDYDDGRLRVRPADYMATVDGAILPLKPRELGLLAALASAGERVVTRAELLASVWDGDEEISSRAVDACVARLRSTLAAALPDVRYVHTHARIGYRFAQEPVTAPAAEASPASAGRLSSAAGAGAASAAVGAVGSAAGEVGSASNL
jgi:DNA-binding winged helix-turn-helix (wHTH) protein